MEDQRTYPENLEQLLKAFENLDKALSPVLRELADGLNSVIAEMAVHTSLIELLFDHSPELKDTAADIATLKRLEGDLQVEDREI